MLIDKLLDYVKYETTSYENNECFPSSETQFELAKHLKNELEKLGLKHVQLDEYCYVYGYLEGDPNYLTIGLNAHMDTSEAASGKNCNPRVIENYDGGDIKLNDNLTTTVNRFPNLKKYIGKTLVVTDGNTLLGADDKAGIAVIMETLETLVNHPEIKHGPIWVCFSPDEEVGRGTDHFNYDLFKVDFAYTLDGDAPENVEFENFNAASAQVKVNGISVHPGSAKNKMINAATVAMEFHSLLDPDAVPEKTEGYEGFNHLVGMKGECACAELSYIIRNHDINLLNKQKHDFEIAQKTINDKYGYEVIELKLVDAYRNMREKFEGNMKPIDVVKQAMENLNMTYHAVAIRGGTDGAELTWKGILCPNLGTGGDNFHGVHELWCKEDGEQAVKLLLEILSLVTK